MAKKSRRRSRLFRRGIPKIVSQARIFIAAASAIVLTAFTVIQWKEIPFGEAVSAIRHDYFQTVLLSFYYGCWVFGTNVDVNAQYWVYVTDPERGKIRLSAIGAVATLTVAGALLLLLRHNERLFALCLAMFAAVDMGAWRYLVYFLRPILKASRDQLQREGDFFALAQFDCVAGYITGRWHWYRFVPLCAISIAMCLVAFSDLAKTYLALLLSWSFQGLPSDKAEALLPDFLLLLFVLVSEIWIWTLRLQMWSIIRAIDVLEERYTIKPKIAAI